MGASPQNSDGHREPDARFGGCAMQEIAAEEAVMVAADDLPVDRKFFAAEDDPPAGGSSKAMIALLDRITVPETPMPLLVDEPR